MLKNLSERCLVFLYEQVKANKISQLKKGMAEDLEKFVTSLLEEVETERITDRMKAQAAGKELAESSNE